MEPVEDYVAGNFLGLPDPDDGMEIDYAIIPAPYEGTVCFGAGASDGPAAIIDVSPHMEWHDEETGVDFDLCGLVTLPPIPPAKTPVEQMQRVYDICREQHEAGRFCLTLGGEHSISAPAVRAAVDARGPVSVLQFDAHADLRDSYTGGKYSHASVMRRISEITDTFVQVGIRSYSAEEAVECPDAIGRIITPRQVRAKLDEVMETILERLTERVYVTFDMDAFDPAVAPGVGTPEPGGLDWFAVTEILKAVAMRTQIISADIVETAPIAGQVVTQFTAARLAAKMIAYTL